MLKKWETLPDFMKNDEVRVYYNSLQKKKISMFLKRAMDFVGGVILLIILAIPMTIIAVMIKLDSEGPVFYRQERVTTYGKHFKIHKFRTMVSNADKIGSAVTVGNDSRITKVGAKLRGCRLDELPQVFDLISGKFRTMTDARDQDGNLLPDEVRLTKFGKLLRSTSLDELPELLNILFGDSGIIGTTKKNLDFTGGSLA